jgi:hypothetical protein
MFQLLTVMRKWLIATKVCISSITKWCLKVLLCKLYFNTYCSKTSMSRLRIITLGTFVFLLCSCYSSMYKNRGGINKTKELSQKAIFEYLNQPNIFLDDLTGKGLIKIDPLLCIRETLCLNGKVYFDQAMRSDLLKYPVSQEMYQIFIPDSLAGKYAYTSSNLDYEHDYSIIHQFSPLLPTIEPGIYLMEYHIWGNSCGEKRCIRALTRGYLQFRIKNEKITILDGIILTNIIDFIGLGSFSRKQMDEALPGEKIIKFGF